MPLSPQITITPEDITTKNFDISAVTYTSSTATYTATGHTFSTGDIVLVSGLAPDGYNGTFTLTGTATNTFTVANTTNATVTDAVGNAFWVDPTEYDYQDLGTVFFTNTDDLNDPTVNLALVQAAQAQADATTALANALTAYNAAVASLQPSASTIVNSTNQITAIATNGITVYSGSSSTSGARVVMNSAGLAGYDSSNNATFAITASTGAAVFSGSVTGATITGGTLNIAGNAIINSSGYLTATGATITGIITATSGSFTGTINSSSGTIGGFVLGSTYLSSGAGGTGYYWNNSSGALSTQLIYIQQASGSTGISMQNGANLAMGGGSIAMGGGAMSGGSTITTTGAITSGGTLRSTGNIEAASMASLAATGVVWSSSNQRFYLTTSTERHKNNITPVDGSNYLAKILELEPVTFTYKPEYTDNPNQVISGLIAERVAEIPEFSSVVNYDPDGLPESIAYDRLSIFMIPALKQINDRLLALEGK